ncbi:MAG: hypothetical protein H2015_03425 [Chloroflexi bacterium]|nr:hypothetical protein [Chloroflexota bacterium]
MKLDLTENNISNLEEGSVTSYSSFSTLFGNKNRNIKPWNKIIKGEKRVIGTVAYEMALAAKGVIKFGLFGPASIWDFGAGLLIIKEAGGVIYFLDENYNIQDKFYSFESLIKKNESTDEKMIYEWTGQFLIGGPMIMNLKDSKKFV